MSTWIGTLSRGGFLTSDLEEAGIAVAAFVVGEERLSELREWMSAQARDVVHREEEAAIEVCIWMAHADRHLAPEEREMLERIVLASQLGTTARDRLAVAIDHPPSLTAMEERLTHPVLRELMLALSWELALADGRIERSETDFYASLAERLGVTPERADELRDAVAGRVA